jgi:hypothetical protein
MQGHEKLSVRRGSAKRVVHRSSTHEEETVSYEINELVCECGKVLMRSPDPIKARPEDVPAYREHVAEQMVIAESAKAQIEIEVPQVSASRRKAARDRRAKRMRELLKTGDRLRYVGDDPGYEGMTMRVKGFDMFHSKIEVDEIRLAPGKRAYVSSWMWFGDVELVEDARPALLNA